MYACLVSLLLAIVGLADCVAEGATPGAFLYALAAGIIMWRLFRIHHFHGLLRSHGWRLTEREAAWSQLRHLPRGSVPTFEEIAALPNFSDDISPLENLRRLWHDGRRDALAAPRASSAALGLIAVLYHSLAFSLVGGLPNGKHVVAELGGFPILAFYPGGAELLAFVAIVVYIPLYLIAFIFLDSETFGTPLAARILGIVAAFFWCLFIPTF